MQTAVDTNIISALWSREPASDKAKERLAEVATQGAIVMCAPVFAELMAHPNFSLDFFTAFCESTRLRVEFNLEKPVWILAGERYAAYVARRRASGGGASKRLLTDFIIGAHAQLSADCLLTEDRERFTLDFPDLAILTLSS